ncbi:hypothetical protein MMU07_20740 [Aquiflexum sp. LQ15W]|uniref:hypothetical protein n=1 Tax=Cognataquiflexum nitidum TaxID=2922272 RepID=UPI001F142672|nr:hypothetical protein [Cognataquiflexum nitidum]MCH6202016.1 hypothetical protein [Cognataquiflexum nitidum]
MIELEQSIENTLETSDLSEINIDLAEVTLDSFLNDGVLKDLPIVSSIMGFVKMGIKTQEWLFLKKILKFFTQLDSTTKKERLDFISKVEKNEEYNKKVGLALLLIIDKLEDLEKPEIIGKLFAASIKGEIDYKMFLRLSYLVQKLFIPDLNYLRKINEGSEVDFEKQEELYLSGFMLTLESDGVNFDGRSDLGISPYTKILLSIIDKK